MPSDTRSNGKRERRPGGREAADRAVGAREVIDNAPSLGGELSMSAVGLKLVAEGFLRWRDGDSGDQLWLNARADKIGECGRPGGPVFAATKTLANGEAVHSVAGLLRCNLHGICPVDAEIRSVERWEQGWKAFKEFLAEEDGNALAHVILTVPRALTSGHDAPAQAKWTESVQLARLVWGEWVKHGMRFVRQRWDVAGTLRVTERQYSNGHRWLNGERYGTGVHLHWHNAWAVRAVMVEAGEMAVAQVIYDAWQTCLVKVVTRERAVRADAFDWVNINEPMKALEQGDDGTIKGTVSVRFVPAGEAAEQLLRYLLKELAFGAGHKTSNAPGKSRSFSWGQLLTLAESPLRTWARQAYRWHCVDSHGQRSWAWSFVEGCVGDKRSFAARAAAAEEAEELDEDGTKLEDLVLGASATASEFARRRRTKEHVKDRRLFKSGAIEAEGMDGFKEDERSQEEKRAALKEAADKRAAGRARYLAAKGSRGPWVVMQMEKQGYKLDVKTNDFVRQEEDLGSL